MKTMPDRPTDQPDLVEAPPPVGNTGAAPPWFTRQADGRRLLAAILITFGVYLLVVEYFGVADRAFLFALGLAFAVARVISHRPGLAVPAGLLLGIGAFVVAQQTALLPGDDGGWFFLFLGGGFVATYLIAAQPRQVWPLIPGFVCAVLGLTLVDPAALVVLAPYTWLANYWPVALIVLGAWLLARDQIPEPLRGVLGAVGALLAIGFAVFTVAVLLGSAAGLPLAWTRAGGVGPFVALPVGQTQTLSAPPDTTGTLRIVNLTGGQTVVQAADTGQVQVEARQLGMMRSASSVTLTPVNGILTLAAPSAPVGIFGAPTTDFTVQVPTNATLEIESSSGAVQVTGVTGAVQLRGNSGSFVGTDLGGAATINLSSGEARLTNVVGPAQVATSSGQINGSGLQRPRSFTTSSGSVRLSGTFADTTVIQTSSGSVWLGLAPASDSRISVTTSSGQIRTASPFMTTNRATDHTFDGQVGAGEGLLTIQTSSGSVTLASSSG